MAPYLAIIACTLADPAQGETPQARHAASGIGIADNMTQLKMSWKNSILTFNLIHRIHLPIMKLISGHIPHISLDIEFIGTLRNSKLPTWTLRQDTIKYYYYYSIFVVRS